MHFYQSWNLGSGKWTRGQKTTTENDGGRRKTSGENTQETKGNGGMHGVNVKTAIGHQKGMINLQLSKEK